MLSTPGFASAFTPSSYAQNEWTTSSDVTWNSISLPDRQHELRRLDAAVGRVAVRELPLLADHLHGQHGAARLRDGVRPAAAAGAVVGEQLGGAEDRQEEHAAVVVETSQAICARKWPRIGAPSTQLARPSAARKTTSA